MVLEWMNESLMKETSDNECFKNDFKVENGFQIL